MAPYRPHVRRYAPSSEWETATRRQMAWQAGYEAGLGHGLLCWPLWLVCLALLWVLFGGQS